MSRFEGTAVPVNSSISLLCQSNVRVMGCEDEKTEYLWISVLYSAGRWKPGDISQALVNGQKHKFRQLN